MSPLTQGRFWVSTASSSTGTAVTKLSASPRLPDTWFLLKNNPIFVSFPMLHAGDGLLWKKDVPMPSTPKSLFL